MPTAEEVASVLAPGGRLAAVLPGFESRGQQQTMAELVAEAIRERTHAIVEAPTGTGKSFAYLVPLIQHALATGRPVVVSTGTIALQEQLIQKDIPLLQRLWPELRAVLVKGRQNYLSRRRLGVAHDGQQALFDTREDAGALREIAGWAKSSEQGDLADLGWEPPPQVWRQVQSDRGNCLGRRCPTYDTCFFYAARRRMEQAHLLVVNHHLYFSDLGLREEHAAILPPHDIVVFDEAHQLEDIATDHLGVRLAEGQVRYALDGLLNRAGKGLLADPRYDSARPAVVAARTASERFWGEVAGVVGKSGDDTVKLVTDAPLENVLSPSLEALARDLGALEARAADDNQQQELKAQAGKLVTMAGALRALLDPADADRVHFAHCPKGRGGSSLAAAPLHVGPLLKERLFDQTATVILTSATLAADDSDRFLFLRRRLGIEGGVAKRLDSPFDYQAQAALLLNRSSLDPNSPRFEQAMAAWLADYAATAEGGIFVLFTSYRQLQAVHDLARPALDKAKRFVLRHGDGMPRAQMLELFKRTGDAILFGTSSFWEGVDVPGNALRHVIIAKLPFEVPSHPVTEARHRAIEGRGGNPFMERTVPEAILRLKQGFGRLIRTRSDTGTVAILDSRIATKAYGRYFLRALPACRTEFVDLDQWAPATAGPAGRTFTRP